MKSTRMEKPWGNWVLTAARLLVLGWTWLYTAVLPEQARTTRREEIRSDLHDQIEQECEEGVVQDGTAMELLRRSVSGASDDVGWALPQIPSAMAEHLVRGSDAIGQTRPSPWAISYLAMAALVNASLALSDWNQLWPAWPVVNAVVLAAALLMQRHLWIRGILLLGGSFTIFLVLGMGLLAALNPGPLPWPFNHSSMLEAVLMAPLVILGLLVAARICGAHFDGSWLWPILLSVALVGFGLWGSGTAVDGSTENLLEVSVATAVLCAVWVVLTVGFSHGLKVGSHALLGGASTTMRLLSKVISQSL